MSLFNTAINNNAFINSIADQIYWYDWNLHRDSNISGQEVLDEPLRDMGELEKTGTNATKIIQLVTHNKHPIGADRQIVPDVQLQKDLSRIRFSLCRIADKVNDRINSINSALKAKEESFTRIVKKLEGSKKNILILSTQMQQIADMVELRIKVGDTAIQEHSIRRVQLDCPLSNIDEVKKPLLSKKGD